MAETFIAIGAAVSGAATSAGAAVSSFFTAAGGLGTVASTLSTALSIGSAFSSIAAGQAAGQAKEDQAQQLAVQTAQQSAADSQNRASLAEEYADLVADQEAVQIANGLNPGIGTPASVRTATRNFAERNLSVSRENTRNRTKVSRLQQRSLFKSANTSRMTGFTNALSTGAQAFQAVG
jgi:hypothetical protein